MHERVSLGYHVHITVIVTVTVTVNLFKGARRTRGQNSLQTGHYEAQRLIIEACCFSPLKLSFCTLAGGLSLDSDRVPDLYVHVLRGHAVKVDLSYYNVLKDGSPCLDSDH